MTTTAITPYNKLKELARSESVQERFMQLLGEEGLPFIASVLTVVSESDRLMECEPTSILSAAAQAATYKLTVNPSTGWAYLVPFKKKATFQIGYRGYIQLAMRTSRYDKIHAGPIYVGQIITKDQLTGDIGLEGVQSGDEVVGYIAYFRLKDGYEKHLYMTVVEIREHAEKYSQSYGKSFSAWTTAFPQMAKKTVLKLLLSKYGIMSIDLQGAMSADGNGRDDEEQDYIDAQFEDDETDPETEDKTTEKTNGNGKKAWPTGPIEAIVAANLSQNVSHAKGCLNLSNLNPTTITSAEAINWTRTYLGWKDDDKTSIEAAELTNKGEVVK